MRSPAPLVVRGLHKPTVRGAVCFFSCGGVRVYFNTSLTTDEPYPDIAATLKEIQTTALLPRRLGFRSLYPNVVEN